MTGHKSNRRTLALTATVSPNSITRLQMRMQLGSHLPTFLLVTYGKRGEGDRQTDIQKCVCARGIIPEPDPTGPALPCSARPNGRPIYTYLETAPPTESPPAATVAVAYYTPCVAQSTDESRTKSIRTGGRVCARLLARLPLPACRPAIAPLVLPSPPSLVAAA